MAKKIVILSATPRRGGNSELLCEEFQRGAKEAGHSAEIVGKKFYFLMTAAVKRKDLLERTLEEFRGFTSCLGRAREKGVVYGTGAWNVGDIKASPTLAEAYALGKAV